MKVSEIAKPGDDIEVVIERYLTQHDAGPAFLFLKNHVLTEENTDTAIEFLKGKVPRVKLWGVPLPMGIVWGLLDSLLPEKALGAIEAIMVKNGLMAGGYASDANPFTS